MGIKQKFFELEDKLALGYDKHNLGAILTTFLIPGSFLMKKHSVVRYCKDNFSYTIESYPKTFKPIIAKEYIKAGLLETARIAAYFSIIRYSM
jgi:hypothetical protein